MVTIQRSLGVLIGGLVALLGVGIYITIQLIVLPDVRVIEHEFRIADLMRATQRIDHELDRINQTTRDWSHWDEMYAFAGDRNQAFIDENFTAHWIEALEVDFFVVINTAGDVVGAVTSDGARHLAADTFADLRGESTQSFLLAPSGGHGLVDTRVGVVLLTASNIRDSQGTAPSRGMFYVGRVLDDALVEQMRDDTRLPIEFNVADNTPQSERVEFVSSTLTASTIDVPLLNRTDRAVQIRLQQPRPYFRETQRSVRALVVVLIPIGALGALCTFLIARRLIVQPLRRLARESARFAQTGQAASFSLPHRRDEIGRLAVAFRSMAEEIERAQTALVDERDRFEEDSLTDSLTGLANRRYLERELGSAARWTPGRPVLMAVLDIDFFKRVNDRLGHDVGDQVLRRLGQLLRECSRGGDIWVRSGGEEFALHCRVTDATAAMGVVERVRARVAATPFGTPEEPLSLTVSIGFVLVDVSTLSDPPTQWASLLNVADLALYQVKLSGRNGWTGYTIASTDHEAPIPQTREALVEATEAGRVVRHPDDARRQPPVAD